MLTKTEAISLLSEDFDKNVGLIQVLKHEDNADLLYADYDGVAVRNGDGLILISVNKPSAKDKISAVINQAYCLMSTDEDFAICLRKKFKIEGLKKCYQAFWANSEKIAENPDITIDKLLATDYNIKAVLDNYRLPMTYGEVKTAIEKRGMFGAYVDGSLAGFIGIHSELSMGMLEVFPEYRKRGIGSSLLKKDINYCLSNGVTPFCHVVYGNENSYRLCSKIGVKFYDGFVFWVG